VKIGRTIGVGTSVVQRVLGVNSHDRSLHVGAGRSGTPAAQHGLMVFKIKLSEAKANDGEREEW